MFLRTFIIVPAIVIVFFLNQNWQCSLSENIATSYLLILLKSVGEGIETQSKMMAKIRIVVFTILEINYLMVNLFCNLVRPPFVFIFVVLSSLAALFARIVYSGIAKKAALSSLNSFTIF